VVARLVVFLALVVILLVLRRRYARLLGVDSDRRGWRRAAYLWGYVAVPVPCVMAVVIVGMLVAELSR
jgi:amino acid transporter